MADTTTANYALTKPEPGGSAGSWDDKLNADLDSIDSELALPRVPHNTPTVGATTTLDLDDARVFKFTVSEVTTIALSNVPTSSWAVRILLVITNGSAFAVTWPTAITWLAGSAPTLKASGVDVVELVTHDGGTTWYGSAWFPRHPAGAFTTTDSGGGSPANLKSYAIPAGMLALDGQGVRVRGWGHSANNANAKSVRVTVGGNLLTGQSLQTSVVDYWHMDVTIHRLSATTASIALVAQSNGTGEDVVSVGNTFTVSNWTTTGNTVQFNCTQTDAADVSQLGLTVERLD